MLSLACSNGRAQLFIEHLYSKPNYWEASPISPRWTLKQDTHVCARSLVTQCLDRLVASFTISGVLSVHPTFCFPYISLCAVGTPFSESVDVPQSVSSCVIVGCM